MESRIYIFMYVKILVRVFFYNVQFTQLSLLEDYNEGISDQVAGH